MPEELVFTEFAVHARVGSPLEIVRTMEDPAPRALLFASQALTDACWAKVFPDVALLEGEVEKVSELRVPGLTVKPFKQEEKRVPSVALIATKLVLSNLMPLNETTPAVLEGDPEFTEVGIGVLQDESEYPVKVMVPA